MRLDRWRGAAAFTVAAILTLSVGIGATTAIYSVVDTILLQAAAVSRIPIGSSASSRTGPPAAACFSAASRIRSFSTGEHVLERSPRRRPIVPMGQWMVRTARKAPPGCGERWSRPTPLHFSRCRRCSGARSAPTTARIPTWSVLSHDTWRRHFNADPAVVGRGVEFRARVITGIAAAASTSAHGRGRAVRRFRVSNRSARLLHTDRARPVETAASGNDDCPARARRVVAGRGRRGQPHRRQHATGVAGRRASPPGTTIRSAPPEGSNRPRAATGPSRVPGVGRRRAAHRLRKRREPSARAWNGAPTRGGGAAGDRRYPRPDRAPDPDGVPGPGQPPAASLEPIVGAAGVAMVKKLATVDAPGIFRFTFGPSILPRQQEVSVNLEILGIAFAICSDDERRVRRSSGPAAVAHESPASDGRARRGTQPRRVQAPRRLGRRSARAGDGAAGRRWLADAQFHQTVDGEQGLRRRRMSSRFNLLFPDQYSTARKAETIQTVLDRLRGTATVKSAGFARHGVLITEELSLGTFVPQGRTLDDLRSDPLRSRVRSVSDGYLTAMGVPVLVGARARCERHRDGTTGHRDQSGRCTSLLRRRESQSVRSSIGISARRRCR